MENNRIEKLLALLLIHSTAKSTMAERAELLSIAGFSNTEIADLLNTNSGTISQLLYERRKKKIGRKNKR